MKFKPVILIIAVFSATITLITFISQEVDDSGLGDAFTFNTSNQSENNRFYISQDRGNTFYDAKYFWDENNLNADKPAEDDLIFKRDVKDIEYYQDFPGNLILLAGTEEGVYASVDNGVEWERVFSNYIQGNVEDIALYDDGDNISMIIAGTESNGLGALFFSEHGANIFQESYVSSNEHDPVVGVEFEYENKNKVFAVTKNGLFLSSSDGGRSWSSNGVVDEGIVVKDVIVYPYGIIQGQSVLLVVTNKGLYRSSDEGFSWQHISRHHSTYIGSSNINDIAYNVGSYDIYIATDYGLLKSSDQGYSFSDFSFVVPPNTKSIDAVTVHPDDEDKIYVGIDKVLYVTENGGESWRLYSIETDSSNMDFIFINPFSYYIILTGFS